MTDQSIGRKLGERLVHRDRDQSTALLTQMRTQATQKPRSGNQNQSVETTGLTTLLDTCRNTTGKGLESLLPSGIARTQAVNTAACGFDSPRSIRYLLVLLETTVGSHKHLELVQYALPLPREEARTRTVRDNHPCLWQGVLSWVLHVVSLVGQHRRENTNSPRSDEGMNQ